MEGGRSGGVMGGVLGGLISLIKAWKLYNCQKIAYASVESEGQPRLNLIKKPSPNEVPHYQQS